MITPKIEYRIVSCDDQVTGIEISTKKKSVSIDFTDKLIFTTEYYSQGNILDEYDFSDIDGITKAFVWLTDRPTSQFTVSPSIEGGVAIEILNHVRQVTIHFQTGSMFALDVWPRFVYGGYYGLGNQIGPDYNVNNSADTSKVFAWLFDNKAQNLEGYEKMNAIPDYENTEDYEREWDCLADVMDGMWYDLTESEMAEVNKIVLPSKIDNGTQNEL